MGQKVHPVGFRIGVIRGWQAKWFADKHYTELLQEDIQLRRTILRKCADADVSLVEIDREANQVTIAIHTAKPGIVIGRGGQKVDELKSILEGQSGKKIRINIQEIRQPEIDAHLVAKTVAEQIQRRVAYRRAIKQAVARAIQRGAKGIKIKCAGRLGGAEMSRKEMEHEGRVPLHTLRADIDYGFHEAHTTFGRIGVKVWIYRGDILPEPKHIEELEPPPPPEPEIIVHRRVREPEAVATEELMPEAAEPEETPEESDVTAETSEIQESSPGEPAG